MMVSSGGETSPKVVRRLAPSGSTRGQRLRWRIALGAAVVHALHVSTVYLGPATLLSPMREELKLTIGEVALPLNVFRIVNCIFLAPAGLIIDRIGAKRTLWPALLTAGILSIALPFATNLGHLVLLQGAFACTKLFGGLTALLIVVMSAFECSPDGGSAQAVVLSGWSVAGTIGPGVIGTLERILGWRFAFAGLATVFIIIGLPIAKFTLVDTVIELPIVKTTNNSNKEPEKLLPKKYIALLGVIAALSISLHIVLDHFIVFLREDAGYDFSTATRYMSLMNAVGFLAKLIAGRLSDRLGRSQLLATFAALATAASLSFASAVAEPGAVSSNAVLSFTLCYGLGYSGVFTLVTTALPDFGVSQAGFRSNLNLVCLFGFGFVGSSLASHLRARDGSYDAAFALSAYMWAFVFLFIAFYAVSGKRKQTVFLKSDKPPTEEAIM